MDVKLTNVKKSYKKIEVLNKISFEIKSGKWLSIIGPSGAGKTTLLNLISGLLTPNSGEILVGNTSDKNKRRSLVSYLLQDFPLYPSLSVKDNLKIAIKKSYKPLGPSKEELINKFNLGPYLNKYPSTISGGERQRAALARSILFNRPILLLDEPFSNIDVYLRRDIRRYCRMLQKKWFFSIILVTHDQEDTMSTSDKVIFLDNGEIIQIDKPERMFHSPISKKVGDNFGDVAIVWLPIKVLNNRIDLQNHLTYSSTQVGFRETDFEISINRVKGYWKVKIFKKEFLGSRYRYFVKYNNFNFSVVNKEKINNEFIWILPLFNKKNLPII